MSRRASHAVTRARWCLRFVVSHAERPIGRRLLVGESGRVALATRCDSSTDLSSTRQEDCRARRACRACRCKLLLSRVMRDRPCLPSCLAVWCRRLRVAMRPSPLSSSVSTSSRVSEVLAMPSPPSTLSARSRLRSCICTMRSSTVPLATSLNTLTLRAPGRCGALGRWPGLARPVFHQGS